MGAFSTSDLEMGEWLHGELMPAFGLESEAWAADRLDRVTDRLRPHTASGELYISEVLWLQECQAFTTPGPYVYVSRVLIERLSTDDAAAFIIAHEIAHHELGHCSLETHLHPLLRRCPTAELLAVLLHQINLRLISQECEYAADEMAQDLCLAAGYDWTKCRIVFDVMREYLLDHRQLNAVYGCFAEELPKPAINLMPAFIKDRVNHIKQTHPPLVERLKRLDERFRPAIPSSSHPR